MAQRFLGGIFGNTVPGTAAVPAIGGVYDLNGQYYMKQEGGWGVGGNTPFTTHAIAVGGGGGGGFGQGGGGGGGGGVQFATFTVTIAQQYDITVAGTASGATPGSPGPSQDNNNLTKILANPGVSVSPLFDNVYGGRGATDNGGGRSVGPDGGGGNAAASGGASAGDSPGGTAPGQGGNGGQGIDNNWASGGNSGGGGGGGGSPTTAGGNGGTGGGGGAPGREGGAGGAGVAVPSDYLPDAFVAGPNFSPTTFLGVPTPNPAIILRSFAGGGGGGSEKSYPAPPYTGGPGGTPLPAASPTHGYIGGAGGNNALNPTKNGGPGQAAPGQPAIANRGGGGGGGGGHSSSPGGDGAAGVVILRYPDGIGNPEIAATGTYTLYPGPAPEGSNYAIFTAPGTITFNAT